ncbi:DgyrCDS14603 [Dimorphilus gyrociliatus]|uniref:DgyrCDS14603 n=1 Tax=Dimorphilus gyrociliatus TaxID=2664684 RepID=A0A7I8WEG0_9ANNE|nr:DgyrCDS14603 [Dimorphilus gyrociliatus]
MNALYPDETVPNLSHTHIGNKNERQDGRKVAAQSIRLKISNNLEEPQLDIERLSELLKLGIKEDVGKKGVQLQQVSDYMTNKLDQHSDQLNYAKQIGIDPAVTKSRRYFMAWTKKPLQTIINFLIPATTTGAIGMILYWIKMKGLHKNVTQRILNRFRKTNDIKSIEEGQPLRVVSSRKGQVIIANVEPSVE